MQLTSGLALLAAIAYSAPSAFALPIAGNSDSLDARDGHQYDMDAREFAEFDTREIDDLQFTARELIQRYHQARDYFNELDTRSLDELEREARDFDEFLFTRSDWATEHTKVMAELGKIAAGGATSAVLAHVKGIAGANDLPDHWSREFKVANYLKSLSGVTDFSQSEDDIIPKFNTDRFTRLSTIQANKNTDPAFEPAVHAEEKALATRYKPNQRLAPELASAFKKDSLSIPLLLFALLKNDELTLLDKVSQVSDQKAAAYAKKVLADKDEHVANLKKGTVPKPDQDKSNEWKGLLSAFQNAKETDTHSQAIITAVKNSKEKVKHLRILADPQQSANHASALAALAALDKAKTKAAPAPPTGGQPAKVRRRHFN